MFSQKTLYLYLILFRLGSCLRVMPVDWNASVQQFEWPRPRPRSRSRSRFKGKQTFAYVIQLANILIRLVVLLVVPYNLASQFDQLEIMDKIVGVFVSLLVLATTTVSIFLVKYVRGVFTFINGVIRFHFRYSRIWDLGLDPGRVDGLETVFKTGLVVGLAMWVLAFPSAVYIVEEQHDKFLRYLVPTTPAGPGEGVTLGILAVGLAITFGLVLDLLNVWCFVFTMYVHFYYSWRWMQKLSWHPHITREERCRVRLQYRGMQILHSTLMEGGRSSIYPLICVLGGILLNVCLYCIIRYHSQLTAPLIADLLIITATFFILLRTFCTLAEQLTESSAEIGLSYYRNAPHTVTELDRRLFRSYQPITTTYDHLFTFKRNVYLQILNRAIIDAVVNMLLAFH